MEKEKETYDVNELLRFKNAIEKEKSRYRKYLEEYRKTDEKNEKIITEFEDFLLKGVDLITDELKHHIEVLKREAEARAEARDREHKLKLQRMDHEIRLMREIVQLKRERLRSKAESIEEREIKREINELENELELTRNENEKMETERQSRLESQKETKYQETKMENKEGINIENIKNETKIEDENETQIEDENETKIEDENETKIEDENETKMKSDNERKPDTENESKSQFESEKINRKETESLESDNEKELENLKPVLERSVVMIKNSDKESNQTESPTSLEKFNFTDTLPKQIELDPLKPSNGVAYRNEVTKTKKIATRKVPYLNIRRTKPNTLFFNLSQLSKVVPKSQYRNKIEKPLQAEYKKRHADSNNESDKSAMKDLKNDRERTENKCQMKWSWQRRKRGKEHISRRRECREHSRDYEEQSRKVKKKVPYNGTID